MLLVPTQKRISTQNYMWLMLLVSTQKHTSTQQHMYPLVDPSTATVHLSMERLLLRHKDDLQKAN